MKRAAIIVCALALAIGCSKSDKKKDEEATGTPTPVEAAPDTTKQPQPGDNSGGGGGGGGGGGDGDRVGDDEPPPPPVTVEVVVAGKPIAVKVGEGEGNLESPDGDPGKGWHVRDILGDNVPADASPALVLHSPDESLEIPKGVLRDPKHTLFVKLNRRGVVRFRWFEGKELKGELRGLDKIEIKK